MYGGSWSDLLAGKLWRVDALTFPSSLCYIGTGNEDVRPSEAFTPKHLLTILS